MPNRHTTLTSLFTDIAGAIRSKTGDSAKIKADDFDTAIEAIQSGGGGGYTTNQLMGIDTIDSLTYDGTDLKAYSLYGKTINNLSLPNLTKIYNGALSSANVYSSDLNTLFSKVERVYSDGLSFFNNKRDLTSDCDVAFQSLTYVEEKSSLRYFGGGGNNDCSYENYNNPKYNIITPLMTDNYSYYPGYNVYRVRNVSARNWMGRKSICNFGYSVGTLDIKGWNTAPTSSSSTNSLTYYANNLRKLVIRNSTMCPAASNPSYMWGTSSSQAYFMTGTKNSIYNPNGEHGFIYVPDDLVDTYKNDAKWQACFDVNYIMPLSQYVDPYESYYQQAE